MVEISKYMKIILKKSLSYDKLFTLSPNRGPQPHWKGLKFNYLKSESKSIERGGNGLLCTQLSKLAESKSK